MKKYIDVENTINELSAACMPIYEKGMTGILGDCSSIADIINEQPAADVREINHRVWINSNNIFKCSECGYSFENEGYLSFFNYCPCCGARMDGVLSE